MKEFILNGTKVKLWARTVDAHAWLEIENITKLPFLHPEGIALAPDAHGGSGVPIGCILPTMSAVIPNAIGNDCGCGMRAIETNIKVEDITSDVLRKGIMRGIRKLIPIGDIPHKEAQPEELIPTEFGDPNELPILGKNNGYNKIMRKQIGTLGGGNHFIELQSDEEGFLWVMIHSGSRGVGGRLNTEYNQIAKVLNRRYFSVVPEEAQLAFIPWKTDLFNNFWKEMSFALSYAEKNREIMMKNCIKVIGDNFPDLVVKREIDIHHNYAVEEEHFGQKCFVHRKGATRAGAGEIGIIPGSQGTFSYIVEGLGSEASFMSCSHGAGRKMSRTEAVAKLDYDSEVKMMEDKGIVHAIRGRKDLEEAAGAYKDIDEVMANETDLVRPLVKLRPIAVMKG